MKQILAILFCILLLLSLCACARSDPQAPRAFSAEVSVAGGELPLEGSVELSDEAIILSLSAPASVAGIRYIFRDGQLTTSYGEHRAVTAHDHLPSDAVPEVLYHALAYLGRAEYLSADEGADAFLLNTPYGAAVLSCADGRPLSLTADFSPYVFTFR